MSLTLTNLTIHTPFTGAEEKFNEAMGAREQHWAGRAGKGGDVRPSSTLHEVLEKHFDLSQHDESDLRYAARRLRAAFPDDQGMQTLAAHIESWELYAAEEMTRDMNTMESFLREHGVPMVRPGSVLDSREDQGRRWPANNAGRVHEPLGLPRTTAPLSYPDQTESVDSDRAARGAREPAMSERLRGLAREVRAMSRLSSNPRQKARLLRRSEELSRMSAAQYQRELENDVATSDDPTEANNVLNRTARDLDAEGRAAGAQGDDATSYDDWSEKPGADEQLADDVRDQLLDEDLPRVPAPGRRAGEDQFGDKSDVADEPLGLRRNRADDDILQRVRKGTARFGSGVPRGADRFGGQGKRYSAEAMRESGGDLTATLLNDLDLWYRSGISWF